MEGPSTIEHCDVYLKEVMGYHTVRIPALLVSRAGTLLAFAEGRVESPADYGDIDLVLRRSTDGGRAWNGLEIVQREEGPVTIGNPCPILDHATGAIHLLFTRDNARAFHCRSDDDGVTFSVPVDITDTFHSLPFPTAAGPGRSPGSCAKGRPVTRTSPKARTARSSFCTRTGRVFTGRTSRWCGSGWTG